MTLAEAAEEIDAYMGEAINGEPVGMIAVPMKLLVQLHDALHAPPTGIPTGSGYSTPTPGYIAPQTYNARPAKGVYT